MILIEIMIHIAFLQSSLIEICLTREEQYINIILKNIIHFQNVKMEECNNYFLTQIHLIKTSSTQTRLKIICHSMTSLVCSHCYLISLLSIVYQRVNATFPECIYICWSVTNKSQQKHLTYIQKQHNLCNNVMLNK